MIYYLSPLRLAFKFFLNPSDFVSKNFKILSLLNGCDSILYDENL